jgi:hypothetical protein
MTKSKSSEYDVRVEIFSRKRDRAIARLVAAWEKYQNSVDDDNDVAETELEAALDAVTLANVVHTFEWTSGPHEW